MPGRSDASVTVNTSLASINLRRALLHSYLHQRTICLSTETTVDLAFSGHRGSASPCTLSPSTRRGPGPPALPEAAGASPLTPPGPPPPLPGTTGTSPLTPPGPPALSEAAGASPLTPPVQVDKAQAWTSDLSGVGSHTSLTHDSTFTLPHNVTSEMLLLVTFSKNIRKSLVRPYPPESPVRTADLRVPLEVRPPKVGQP